MYCKSCGKKVPDDSKFCPRCGGDVLAGSADSQKKEAKQSRSRPLKILGYFAIFCAVFVIVTLIFYFVSVSRAEVYKHPAVGFSINYPKTLKMETPTLPAQAKCKKAAPCFLLFKNPSYSNSVVNWVFVLSAADAGAEKNYFVSEMEKAFQVDIGKGEAETLTVDNKRVYKYVNDPAKPSQSLTAFYKMLQFDASVEQSLYAFFSGDSVMLIGFKNPPAGAPAKYKDYLNIQSLKIP